MTFGKRVVLYLVGSAALCLLSVAVTRAQDRPADTPLMAEQVFKNVQVLKGIPVSEFMGTMGFLAASLSMNCTDCHVSDSSGSWARYADDTPIKQMTRRMIVMVNTINRANFGSARAVTCYTCHRGSQRPKVTPSLAEQYGAPPPQDPDEVEILEESTGPAAEQLLDRYIQAVRGSQRLGNTKTVVARGTYTGFDTDFDQVPVAIYASAPYQRSTVIQMRPPFAERIFTYDGRTGWIAGADRPVPVLAMTEGEMEAARLDAVALFFPASIKGAAKWRAGSREVSIDNRPLQMIEGATAAGARVKLYFDRQSGLLIRLVRYTNTVLGLNPEHTEYDDYREVAGVRIPFRWTVTWTNGQSTTELSDVQLNVAVDASRFTRPVVTASR